MSWTEITRIKYRRDGLRYASDTTDEEWALIEPHMPAKFRVGRPRETRMRARPLIFLPASKPRGPPASVVLIDWLSITPADGLASRPATSPYRVISASGGTVLDAIFYI